MAVSRITLRTEGLLLRVSKDPKYVSSVKPKSIIDKDVDNSGK